MQWTVDAYSLSLAALLLPTGSLADILGRRRVFALGLAIFTVGSLLCGCRSGLMLILCRGLQGVGGATVFSTSLALLAQTFHGTRARLRVRRLGGGRRRRDGARAAARWTAHDRTELALDLLRQPADRRRRDRCHPRRGSQEFRPPHARRIDLAGFALFTARPDRAWSTG